MNARIETPVAERLAATLLVLFFVQALAAEAPAGDELDEHLAAGEFAPALERAEATDDPAARDGRLARIARAQRSAGNLGAALRSAGTISDDRFRADMLRELSVYPSDTPGGYEGSAPGASGGGVEPDFESLIELIESTIAPNSWDGVGGPGAVDSFAGGVFVDPHGVLKPVLSEDAAGKLSVLRSGVAPPRDEVASGPRRTAPLRMISLVRLEREIQKRRAAGMPPDETMEVLAGLQRIHYVFVYPETNDIVLAGPAGDWRVDREHRVVSTRDNTPVVRLDDLVVVFRSILGRPDARFGCSITPTQENLARTKVFLQASGKTSLDPRHRNAWLERLRASVGKQKISVYGIDPGTRVGRILVEADYRMKLVGMGLEEGVLGVKSYLDLVEVPRGQAPPPMDVLRWWFTLNYNAVVASERRDAFEIRGQGVQVMSENELLTQQGKRVHTGKSDELNQRFAQSFTDHFEALAAKYPIYAELRNIFDLALVAALLDSERLPEKVRWQLAFFADGEAYPLELGRAASEVETVINHRIVNRRHILAGVSGGVRVDPWKYVTASAIKTDAYGKLAAEHLTAKPEDLPAEAWWWDQD